jgi:molybdopterin/thiamine biosynthesis adenylyltransferase/proteasome lid subunit RPN8/RPN11
VLLDTVADSIDQELGTHPAERGGALLGPEGREVVTHLLPDPFAYTTHASYEASDALVAVVADFENDSILRWKGIVHSHPGSMACLSGPDLERLYDGLQSNPWLPWLHAPIFTHQAPAGQDRPPATRLVNGWLTWHTARLLRGGRIVTEIRRVVIVPLESDLRLLAERLRGERSVVVTDPGTGVSTMAGRVTMPGGAELLVMASDHYPLAAPVVLFTVPGEDTRQLAVAWDATAGVERLADAVLAVLPASPEAERNESTAAFGPRPDIPTTDDQRRAAQAGWGPAEGDPTATAAQLRAQLMSRGTGLITDALANKRVLIVGCGSVGSYAAEQLARSGLGALTLVDPDRVEPTNLSRSAFEALDLDCPKVEALARRLLNVNPSIGVAACAVGVGEMPTDVFDGLVASADLVLATTDDPVAQLQIARHAQRHRRPSLFVGLTAGARGGEVIMTVPEKTPCYRCATSIRHQRDLEPDLARDRDYGTGRMEGVTALGVDIQHVTGVAVKLALSLLLRDEPEAEISRVAPEILEQGISFLTFSMSQRYWFYPGYFQSIGGQFGYQSVGLAVDHDPDCPICGTSPDLDLPDGDDRVPSASEIRTSLQESERQHSQQAISGAQQAGRDEPERSVFNNDEHP